MHPRYLLHVPWVHYRVHSLNGTSIGSSVFVGLTVMINRHTETDHATNVARAARLRLMLCVAMRPNN